MPLYKASAPGKVILHGEHSVVYGKTALAVSLGIRTSAAIQEVPERHPKSFHILLKNLSPEAIVFDWARVVEDLTKRTERLCFDFASPEALDREKYLEIVTGFVQKYKEETGWNPPDATSQAIVIVLYVFCAFAQMASYEFLSIDLSVDSELEIGSGVGSSASFAVATVAVILHYVRAKSARYSLSRNFRAFSDTEKKLINDWAFECEKISHGNPSGVDNSVCTYGSIVEFRKGSEPAFRSLRAGLRVCLVNTNVKRNTKTQVQKVVSLRSRHEDVVDKLMESCDSVALAALAVVNGADGELDASSYQKLKELFEINHCLLRALGVSHPSLELVHETAESLGYGCKLTGAGGGGFAIVLLPPDTEVDELTSKLNGLGFQTRVARLGGSGATVDV